MSQFNKAELFPLTTLDGQSILAAINNLHDRVKVMETRPVSENVSGDGTLLSPSDRAVLDETARFLGLHTTVAETLNSKAQGIEDIDPTTGRQRVVVERPAFSKIEPIQTGS